MDGEWIQLKNRCCGLWMWLSMAYYLKTKNKCLALGWYLQGYVLSTISHWNATLSQILYFPPRCEVFLGRWELIWFKRIWDLILNWLVCSKWTKHAVCFNLQRFFYRSYLSRKVEPVWKDCSTEEMAWFEPTWWDLNQQPERINFRQNDTDSRHDRRFWTSILLI